jgi:hypothetical protein
MSKLLFPSLLKGNSNDLVYNDLSPSRTMRVTARIPGITPAIRGLQASSLVAEDRINSLAQDHGASNLVDGDPDSYAAPGSNHLDYSVRLNATYHVTAVSIDWNGFGTDPGSINRWMLLGRNENQPWQLLGSGELPGEPTSNIVVDTVATDLRIVADGSNPIGIYELRAFGSLLQPLEASFTEIRLRTASLKPAPTSKSMLIPQLPQTDGNFNPDRPTFRVQQQTTFPSATHISALQITWSDTATSPRMGQEWTVEGRARADLPWMVVARGDRMTDSVTLLYLDCIATELRVTTASASGWSSYNVQLFGASTLGPLKVSSLSVESVVPGFGPAGNLADRDPTTVAYPGALFFDYLLDPAQPTFVDAVKIVWRGFGTDASYINSWQLLGLPEESTTWQVVKSGGFPDASETLVPVQGRYRMLRVAAQSALNWIGIYEVQVFGTSIAPIAATPQQAASQIATKMDSHPSVKAARSQLLLPYSSSAVKPDIGNTAVPLTRPFLYPEFR